MFNLKQVILSLTVATLSTASFASQLSSSVLINFENQDTHAMVIVNAATSNIVATVPAHSTLQFSVDPTQHYNVQFKKGENNYWQVCAIYATTGIKAFSTWDNAEAWAPGGDPNYLCKLEES